MAALLAAGAALYFHQPASAEKTPAPKPGATPKPVATAPRQPPQPGKPWKNSLDMRYVPVGDIWVATTETRVRDYQAFYEARGYDLTGGMFSSCSATASKSTNIRGRAPAFRSLPSIPWSVFRGTMRSFH